MLQWFTLATERSIPILEARDIGAGYKDDLALVLVLGAGMLIMQQPLKTWVPAEKHDEAFIMELIFKLHLLSL